MFFKDCVADIAPVYDYQLDYLQQGLSELESTQRAFISKSNSIYKKHSGAAVAYVSNYIASQQHALLRNFVPRRHHIVELIGLPNLEPFFNTTYFDRCCHLMMIPMRGSVSYSWTEGPKDGEKVSTTLIAGRAYLLNNRAPRQVVEITSGFQCYISLWIDFDLMYYLKEFDGNSKIDRKADEYF